MLRNHLPYNNLRLWNQALIKKNICIQKSQKVWLQSKWAVDFLISKNFSGNYGVQVVNVLRYSSHSKWHKLSRSSVQFIFFSYMDLACFTLVTYTVMITHYFCLSRWCEHCPCSYVAIMTLQGMSGCSHSKEKQNIFM